MEYLLEFIVEVFSEIVYDLIKTGAKHLLDALKEHKKKARKHN